MPRSTTPASCEGVGNGMPSLPKTMRTAFHQHVAEAEGEQQRIVDRALVERADQEALDRHAEQADGDRRDQQPPPEAAGQRGDPEPGIGADHEQRAMREIHHAQHAEDDRQAERDHDQDRAEGNSGEELHGDEFGIHGGDQAGKPSSEQLRSIASEAGSLASTLNRSASPFISAFFLDSSTSTDCTDWWSQLR